MCNFIILFEFLYGQGQCPIVTRLFHAAAMLVLRVRVPTLQQCCLPAGKLREVYSVYNN